MEFLKKILIKIGTGMAYGFGIGLILVLITLGVSKYYENKADEMINGSGDPTKCRDYQKCEENSGLSLEITRERVDDDFVLLGEVKNSGDIEWTSVKIKAELFDEEGNFIDECTERVDQKISPGKVVNFKLSCSSCSKVNLEGYATYIAYIIDGNTW